MKPLRHFSKIVVVLFSLHFISSTLLGVCKNNGFVKPEGNERNENPKNDLDFQNDWFHWGQLYSYCMQVICLKTLFCITKYVSSLMWVCDLPQVLSKDVNVNV